VRAFGLAFTLFFRASSLETRRYYSFLNSITEEFAHLFIRSRLLEQMSKASKFFPLLLFIVVIMPRSLFRRMQEE
jgi:hypothetical protein